MKGILVADIGGTNSRFAIAGAEPSKLKRVISYENDAYSSFELVLLKAISDLQIAPNLIVIAVAGPVDGTSAVLTNRGWRMEASAISSTFGQCNVHIINDFEALAQSLPHLSNSSLETISNVGCDQTGHKLVVGAGTGLGVGFLIKTKGSWLATAGEGGHVALPIQTEREFELMQAIGSGLKRVSAEKVLSGSGLVALCNAILGLTGRDAQFGHPAEVLDAVQADDPAAREAATTFVNFLGRVVGDHALSLIPKGGIYLGGGVTPKLIDCVGAEVFIEQLHNKGRVQSTIDKIPVHVIRVDHSGLIGSAAHAQSVFAG